MTFMAVEKLHNLQFHILMPNRFKITFTVFSAVLDDLSACYCSFNHQTVITQKPWEQKASRTVFTFRLLLHLKTVNLDNTSFENSKIYSCTTAHFQFRLVNYSICYKIIKQFYKSEVHNRLTLGKYRVRNV